MAGGQSHDAHHYRVTCSWTGSTAEGYDAYDRNHTAAAPPATPSIQMSSDPAFLGDPTQLNPEQLLVLAAASCQLLSFLAVAARARIDVVEYHDDGDAVMPVDEQPVRITRIVLHPRVTVRGPVGDERLLHLTEVAHRECFIANSVSAEIVVDPTFTHLA